MKGDLSGDFSKFVGSSGPAAVAGYADITVPAAFEGHLPLGDHVHRRAVGRAEADRARLLLGAGDPRPSATDVPRALAHAPRSRLAAAEQDRTIATAPTRAVAIDCSGQWRRR